ncbi:MAG: hypothetical protein D6768_04220 [Chloroflexi bacterium]|nr:MAG: hypothetical protein D6768_04220 [Chloroflexota bacterium]
MRGRKTPGGGAWSAPVVAAGTVYFGSFDSSFYALTLGRERNRVFVMRRPVGPTMPPKSARL